MITLVVRAAWLLRSRQAAGTYLHRLQHQNLTLSQRWGVVYRALLAERGRGLPHVSDFEREIAVGDKVQYTKESPTRRSGLDCSICVRAAYKDRRGEWVPPLFVDANEMKR